MKVIVELGIAGLVLGSIYALLAVSLNIVWDMARVTNIAHGEVLTLGAYATLFLTQTTTPLALSIPALVVLTSLVAVGFNWVFSHVLKEQNREYGSLLVTWGLGLIVIASLREFVGTDYQSVDFLRRPVGVIGEVSFPLIHFVVLAVALILSGSLALILRHTRVGRSVRSVAENADLAATVGINIETTRAIALALGLNLGVLTGALLSATLVFYPTIGQLFILKAVAIVLVASLGALWLSWSVGLALGVIEIVVQFEFGALVADMLPFAMIILFLMLRRSDVEKLRKLIFSKSKLRHPQATSN